jgi:hypothetical protein
MCSKALYVFIHVYELLYNIQCLQAILVHRSAGPLVYLAHIIGHLLDYFAWQKAVH